MKYQVTPSDELVIVIAQPLSDYKRYLFTKLYQPLLEPHCVLVYDYLNNQLPPGTNCSEIGKHQKIMKALRLTSINQLRDALMALEGVGLLRSFVKNNENKDPLYLYLLPSILEPTAFFKNALLSVMLEKALGHEQFMATVSEFLVYKYDVTSFVEITTPLDEAFYRLNDAEYTNWGFSSEACSPAIVGRYFDYQLYLTLLMSHDIIDSKVALDNQLFDIINQLAWLYGLSEELMKDATIFAITDGQIDFQKLKEHVKIMYDRQNITTRRTAYSAKKHDESVHNNNKLIQTLNTLSPLEIVQTKYGTSLLGSEIAMFERLLNETAVNPGVLNVLIIYVLDSREGEIPTINYFKKIINAWYRKGITTTEEALKYIERTEEKVKTYNTKPVKTQQWHSEYEKQYIKKPLNSNKDNEQDEMTLQELEKMFKGK